MAQIPMTAKCLMAHHITSLNSQASPSLSNLPLYHLLLLLYLRCFALKKQRRRASNLPRHSSPLLCPRHLATALSDNLHQLLRLFGGCLPPPPLRRQHHLELVPLGQKLLHALDPMGQIVRIQGPVQLDGLGGGRGVDLLLRPVLGVHLLLVDDLADGRLAGLAGLHHHQVVCFGVERGERAACVHRRPETAVLVVQPHRPFGDLVVAWEPALFRLLGCVLHVASSLLLVDDDAEGGCSGRGESRTRWARTGMLGLGLLNWSDENAMQRSCYADSVSGASHCHFLIYMLALGVFKGCLLCVCNPIDVGAVNGQAPKVVAWL